MAMSIAHATASVSRLGAGVMTCLQHLAIESGRLGVENRVVGLRDEYSQADLPLWESVPVSVCPAQRLMGFGYAPSFKRELIAAKASMIHLHGLWMYPTLAALAVAKALRVPRMVSPQGMLEPWPWLRSSWKKRPIWWLWERESVFTAAAIHATAEQEACRLREMGARNPIAIVPIGVDLPNDRSPMESSRPKRTVLFISRIHAKKGLLDLVEAVKTLKPDGWRVVIAGPNERGHEAVVKNAVREAGLERYFEWPGAVYGEAKWRLYQEADLFVLPTYSENFGIVVIEALAAGVPVLTTKAAPWGELPTHGCGWWHDVGVGPLVESLREAMRLSDRERFEMGTRGRALVEAKYIWPRVAREMVGVYQWLLGGGAPPSCVRMK